MSIFPSQYNHITPNPPLAHSVNAGRECWLLRLSSRALPSVRIFFPAHCKERDEHDVMFLELNDGPVGTLKFRQQQKAKELLLTFEN